MRRRQPTAPATGQDDPGRFVLERWLARLPPKYDTYPEWATAAENEQHRRTRAFLLWIKARREFRA